MAEKTIGVTAGNEQAGTSAETHAGVEVTDTSVLIAQEELERVAIETQNAAKRAQEIIDKSKEIKEMFDKANIEIKNSLNSKNWV